jgi:hypothetical protein
MHATGEHNEEHVFHTVSVKCIFARQRILAQIR